MVDALKHELFPKGFSSTSRHNHSLRRASTSRAETLFEQFEQKYSDLANEIERFKDHQPVYLDVSDRMRTPSVASQLGVLPSDSVQDPAPTAETSTERADDSVAPPLPARESEYCPDTPSDPANKLDAPLRAVDEADPSISQTNEHDPSPSPAPTPHAASNQDTTPDGPSERIRDPEGSSRTGGEPDASFDILHELEALAGSSTDGSDASPDGEAGDESGTTNGAGFEASLLPAASPPVACARRAVLESASPDRSCQLSSPRTQRSDTPASSVQTQATSLFIRGSPDARRTVCSPSPEEQATASINRDHMGESLVPSLTRLVNRRDCFQLIKVMGPSLDLVSVDRAAFVFTNPDHRANVYRAVDAQTGCSNLGISRRQDDFYWPDFASLPGRPTDDQMLDFLEATITQPPSSPVSYYGGEASVPFDRLLHAGQTLTGCKYLTVANAEYYHIGERASGSPFHHEDANFWSCNLTEGGWKIFIFIKDTEKFEAFIRDNYSCGECDQFVRHLNLIIAPSRLRAEGIDHKLICAGPGDLIVTQPGVYHACINYSACFARSINFLLPEEPLLPSDLVVCDDCGLNGLRAYHDIQHVPSGAGQKRRAVDSPKSRPSKISRSESREMSQAIACIERADPFCPLPQLHDGTSPPAGILKLAASVRSRQAIRQFVDLVDARRTVGKQLPPSDSDTGLGERLKSRIRQIKTHEKGKLFSKYQLRLQRIALVRDLEALKTYNVRHSPETVDTICAEVGWTRQVLNYNRSEGQNWQRICGRFDGILPFILLSKPNPFNVKTSDFVGLSEISRRIFHDLLDDGHTEILCAVGYAFEKHLRDGQPVKFAWEGHAVDWNGLSNEELLAWLAVESPH